MRPLIGITGYVETARWGDWHVPATLLPQQYVDAVHAAGGRAAVLPPAAAGADRVVAALDALVLAGGADLDPARYGAVPAPETTGVRPDRDAGELPLLAAAAAAGLPVLGICRGMQVMVAAAGGALHQHLPHVVGHHGHRLAPGRYAEHPVRTVPGTRLAGLIGPTATVPSYHHQGVADAGSLTVAAHAADGTIEAVERPDGPFFLGVLWHPEGGDDPRLFAALIAAAAIRQQRAPIM
jgi:putative glutamine amidotransferase